jgi:hypothetical protein
VWTHGGETAEFVFVRSPAAAPRVRLRSYTPSARVSDGGVPVALQWQPGQDLEITLSHPVAAYHDELSGGAEVAVHHLTVATDVGILAATLGNRADRRSLGVFVSPVADSSTR